MQTPGARHGGVLGPRRKGGAGAKGVGNDIEVTAGTWGGPCWDPGEWDRNYFALSTSPILMQSVHFSLQPGMA